MGDTALPAWKPDVVIYHDHCADGFAAAWACWTLWRDDCAYVPASYGQPAPDVSGKNVLMVDFSYKRSAMDAIANSACSVVVLDHHKTAEQELAPFRFHESGPGAISPADVPGMLCDLAELNRPAVIAIFDMERSGARMAWDFCRGAGPWSVPLLIHLIEDRDLWRFRHEDTKPFSLWLRSEAFSFQRFAAIATDLDDDAARGAIMAEARAMQRFSDAKVDEIAAFARRETLAGHEPMVVSCPPMFASEVGHALLDKYPNIPFAAMYYDGPTNRMWSLRSRDDREDVSVIAGTFGGGGHRNAAGFSVPATKATPAVIQNGAAWFYAFSEDAEWWHCGGATYSETLDNALPEAEGRPIYIQQAKSLTPRLTDIAGADEVIERIGEDECWGEDGWEGDGSTDGLQRRLDAAVAEWFAEECNLTGASLDFIGDRKVIPAPEGGA